MSPGSHLAALLKIMQVRSEEIVSNKKVTEN